MAQAPATPARMPQVLPEHTSWAVARHPSASQHETSVRRCLGERSATKIRQRDRLQRQPCGFVRANAHRYPARMPEPEQITAEGLAALRAEIEQLESDGRAQMAVRIKAARELGDLKENAEYHIAKEDQAHLETKIKRLNQRLRAARVVDVAEDRDVVGFGSRVAVVDEASGKELELTLVGPTESDLKNGRLSFESPVAQALVGARAGETVTVQTPGGDRRYRVDRIG